MVLLAALSTDADADTVRKLTVFGDAYLALSKEEATAGPSEALKVGCVRQSVPGAQRERERQRLRETEGQERRISSIVRHAGPGQM